jgi:hypothetical protein
VPIETLFRDATALVRGYLAGTLPAEGVTVPVVGRVPSPRPPSFVLLRRLGGPRLNLVSDGATIAVEVYADDEGEAMDVAQIARGLLHDLAGDVLDGTQVYRVEEMAGPGLLPDPESGSPRVTFSVTVLLRGLHPAP